MTENSTATAPLNIPEGVGLTALFVAWKRALEARRPDALFTDPFALYLCDALAHTPQMIRMTGSENIAREGMKRDWDANDDRFAYFSVRTRFFDDQLLAAAGRGVRQVVILAAGLDGRVARLDWPSGTTVYELDLPSMSTFKDELLTASALPLKAARKGVSADLAEEWTAPLEAAGFDASRPTVWLIEGLLPYLPREAGDVLIRKVGERSAPGSELLLEHNAEVMESEDARPLREAVAAIGVKWASARDDLAPWLAEHGWRATAHPGHEPSIGHGRNVPRLPAGWLVSAVRA